MSRAADGEPVRRVARRAWSARPLGIAVLALIGLLGTTSALLVHGQAPATRAALQHWAQRTLPSDRNGSLHIGAIEEISPFHVKVESFRVLDAAGTELLAVEGVSARFDPWSLVGTLLLSTPRALTLRHLAAERARVDLRQASPSGPLALDRALRPVSREPSARANAPPDQDPGESEAALALEVEAFELGRLSLSYPGAPGGAAQGHIRRLVGRGRLDGERSSLVVERFGARLHAPSLGSARGTGSLAIDGSRRLATSWHGFVRGIESDVQLLVEGGASSPLRARLRLPRITPELAKRWLEDWPLRAPLSVDLTLEGTPNRMKVGVDARAATSRVSLRGELGSLWPARGTLQLEGSGLDARLFSASAPATNANLKGTLALNTEGNPQLVAVGRCSATHVGGRKVAALGVEARYSSGAFDLVLEGREAGGTAELRVETRESEPLRARLVARGVDLSRVSELGGAVAGRATLTANAELLASRYSATGELEATSLRAGDWLAGKARLEASLSGEVGGARASGRQPEFEARLEMAQAGVAKLVFEQLVATVRGPLDQMHANLEGRDPSLGQLSAHGLVDLAGGVRVSNAALRVGTPRIGIDARVAHWDVREGTGRAPTVRLTSAHGALLGSLARSQRLTRVRVESERLVPHRLAGELGLPWPWPSGSMSGQVEFEATEDGSRGLLDVSVADPRLRGYQMERGRVIARLEGDRFQGHAELAGASLGRARLDFLGTRQGPATSPESWADSELSAELNTDLSLWPVGLALGGKALGALRGSMSARVSMQRPAGQKLPEVFAEVEGRNLSANLNIGPLRDSFEGFGLKLVARLPANEAGTAAEMLLEDAHGPLLQAHGLLGTNLGELLALLGGDTGLEALASVPVAATAQLVRRPLALFPLELGVKPKEGVAQARARLSGTLGQARLGLDAALVNVRTGLGLASTPLDASVGGRLELDSLRFKARAQVGSRGHGVLSARADGQLALGSQPLHVAAAAMLDGVALSAVPSLAEAGLSGALFGSLQLELRESGSFHQAASLRLEDLRVRGQPLGSGPLSLQANNALARGALSLRHEGGLVHFDGRLETSQPAGSGALPFYDSGSATVVGKQVPLEVLTPVLRGIVNPTSGHVGADLAIRSSRDAGQPWRWEVDGTGRVSRGAGFIENLGLELKDIHISALVSSDADGIQVVGTELSARANRPEPSLRGVFELRLNGHTLRPQVGEVDLRLDALPLRLQGASWGQATGQARMTLSEGQGYTAMRVSIPDLQVALPRQTQVDLIDLDSHPDIRIAQYAPRARVTGEAPHQWKVAVELGRGVRLSRSGLDLPIVGQLTLDMGRSVRAAGTIEAQPGGRFDLYGRNFRIDQGSVRLTEDEPDNPLIDVVASWTAPDGTRVGVELSGSAKDPKIATHDDAGLSEAERFRLITGNALPRGTEADREASAASLVGPAFAALQLNQYLHENVGDVSVSVGAGSDANATYTASVRLSDRLWFEGNYKPEAGHGDWVDTLVGVLDYQFSSKWSLRTKLGRSAGSAFDLLWSHRY